MNNCSFVGRLVDNPKVEIIQSRTGEDLEVCSFTLAVYSRRTVKGQGNNALFFDFRAWGQTAIFLEKNFKKSNFVAVAGDMRYEVYEKDGNKIRRYYVNVENVSFCGNKGSTPQISDEEEFLNSIPDFKDIPDE